MIISLYHLPNWLGSLFKKLGIKLQPENWFCYVKDFAKTKWAKRDGLLLRCDDMELQITKLFLLLVFKLQNIPKQKS